jgi:NADH:ubiquinone oxidoreductase subunit E
VNIKDRFIIDTIIEKYQHEKDPVLIILQDVQEVLGYVGKDYLERISNKSGYPLTALYGIVSFYPFFKLYPPGKNIIKLCMGTACHVKGSESILGELKRQLCIDSGQTTRDKLFTLEAVRCLGCCGLAPVIMINEETYGRVKVSELKKILDKYREEG